MATDSPVVLQRTYTAGADLSGQQYRFVKMNTSGAIVPIAAVTDRPLGVLQNNPASGQAAVVMSIGITKLYAGGNITPSDGISTSAAGLALTVNLAATTPIIIAGTALSTGTNGAVITAMVSTTGDRADRAA